MTGVDPGTTARLSRMDELQSQAMTRNLREREEMKLGGTRLWAGTPAG